VISVTGISRRAHTHVAVAVALAVMRARALEEEQQGRCVLHVRSVQHLRCGAAHDREGQHWRHQRRVWRWRGGRSQAMCGVCRG